MREEARRAERKTILRTGMERERRRSAEDEREEEEKSEDAKPLRLASL